MKLRNYHKKYGRVVRLGPNYISVSDKDMLKQILVKDDLTKGPNYDLLAGNKRDSNIKMRALTLIWYVTAAGNTQTMFNTRDKVFHKQRVTCNDNLQSMYVILTQSVTETCRVACFLYEVPWLAWAFHAPDHQSVCQQDRQGYQGDSSCWWIRNRQSLGALPVLSSRYYRRDSVRP